MKRRKLMQTFTPRRGDALEIGKITVGDWHWEAAPGAPVVLPQGHRMIIEVDASGRIEIFREAP